MSRWFRVYDDLIDDPKVQRLSAELFRALVNLWCLASNNDGKLPTVDVMAFKLRVREDRLNKMLVELKRCGLIDVTDHGMVPHNWSGRQYKSDVSNERVKRHRERKRNTDVTLQERPQSTETEAETEAETERKIDTSLRSDASGYVFESGVIRLNKKDFDNWQQSFSYLDLRAELLSLSPWAAGQEKWFHAVQGALAKRNREQKLKTEQARAQGAGQPQRGIAGII